MNDSNHARTMYETVPAAAELNKVKGFDPLKFLRRTRDVMKLDLPYQKLWFRMAHPNGRMRVTALRITEQMAIFEAKVFLDRSDAEPFSMSVAQQNAQSSRDFVKAAQDEALSQALTDAGFGIQMVSSEVRAAMEPEKPNPPAETAAVSAVAASVPANAPQKAPGAQQTPRKVSVNGNAQAAEKAPQKLPEGQIAASVEELPVSPNKNAEDTLPAARVEQPEIVQHEEKLPADEPVVELPVQTQAGQPEPAVKPETETPAFTQDMPVEEILKTMTLEQAQEVVVDDGICRGMTIAQVAEKRPVNLRFYVIPGKSKNNMVRAAAQLVLNSLQKAG